MHDLQYCPADQWERPEPPAGETKHPSSYSAPDMFPEEYKKWFATQEKFEAAEVKSAEAKTKAKKSAAKDKASQCEAGTTNPKKRKAHPSQADDVPTASGSIPLDECSS